MSQPESEIARLRAALELIETPDPCRNFYNLALDHFAIARAALAIQPPAPTGPSPEWWDDNSVQCGNCGVQIVTLGGQSRIKGTNLPCNRGLSDAQGDDVALCGLCAGVQMEAYYDEIQKLKAATPSPAVQEEAAAEVQAKITRLATNQLGDGCPVFAAPERLATSLDLTLGDLRRMAARSSPAVQEAADALADYLKREGFCWCFAEETCEGCRLLTTYFAAKAQAGKESAS